MLDNIRVVLVETSHPGNIGSAARAMKTMGLSQLYLVAPKSYPNSEAVALASGARDLLEQAVVVPTLPDAIANCEWVIGSSARVRDIQLNEVDPRQCAKVATTHAKRGANVALVFGRERTGLYNEELYLCHQHAIIPANPDYSSLNLAQAVQLFCYELRIAALEQSNNADCVEKNAPSLASVNDLDGLIKHLERVMITTGFLDPAYPKKLMPRLRRLFHRAILELPEIHILRGVLTAIEKSIKQGVK